MSCPAFDGDSDTDLTNRYLWGPVVDQILADEQVTSLGSAGDVIWPLTDHLGTARDLAEYNAGTDTTSITNHRVYDSFGNLISETNSAVDHLFGFTARPWDEETDLQYNLNRWYDPVIGQWMSEDPKGLGPDSNVRRYVGNDPLHLIDPEGLEGRPEFRFVGTPRVQNVEQRRASEEFKAAAEERFMEILRELAKHKGTLGGLMAADILCGHEKIEVVFDLTLTNNAYGARRSTKGVLMLNPLTSDYFPPAMEREKYGQGTEFDFRKGRERASPDEIAQVLLAHELGHAILDLNDPGHSTQGDDRVGANPHFIENELRNSMGINRRERYGENSVVPSFTAPKGRGAASAQATQKRREKAWNEIQKRIDEYRIGAEKRHNNNDCVEGE